MVGQATRKSVNPLHEARRNTRYALIEERAWADIEEGQVKPSLAVDPVVVFQVFETSLLMAALRLQGF
eukprot:1026462-Rhodomonas_salina.1